MSDRLEQIKHKALHRKRGTEVSVPFADGGVKCREEYAEDVSWLLQRVEEQEEEIKQLKSDRDAYANHISKCADEIRNLRSKLAQRDNELAEVLRGSEY